MEDVRVESLAIRAFPGLRRLWSGFHQGEVADGTGFDALLARLARAIIDPGYQDTNPWVQKGIALYREQVQECPDAQAAHRIGMRLANDINQLRIPMNEAAPPCVAAYHDDNLHLWLQEQSLSTSAEMEMEQAPAHAASHSAHLIESRGGKLLPFAAAQHMADAPSGWSIHPVEDEASLEFNAPAANAVPAQYRYPEWDYRIGLSRQAWVTVHERTAKIMPARLAKKLLLPHKHMLAVLERIVGALRQPGRARLRRQYEGEDLDAAIDAAVELRRRQVAELRVYARHQIHSRQDVTLLLLLDLSESAKDRIGDSRSTMLELTRDACLLLAVVLERLGERFAVHGFSSNGRHEVGYAHFKNFEQPCDAIALDRIAGMSAGLSTRLGAALRHAGVTLSDQPGERKLLLVLTDGKPSDIDVYDTRYLTEDARNAVVELRSGGIQTFCMNLDPRGEAYAARIFGPARYGVLEQVERLPEKLPHLVLALTRRH